MRDSQRNFKRLNQNQQYNSKMVGNAFGGANKNLSVSAKVLYIETSINIKYETNIKHE